MDPYDDNLKVRGSEGIASLLFGSSSKTKKSTGKDDKSRENPKKGGTKQSSSSSHSTTSHKSGLSKSRATSSKSSAQKSSSDSSSEDDLHENLIKKYNSRTMPGYDTQKQKLLQEIGNIEQSIHMLTTSHSEKIQERQTKINELDTLKRQKLHIMSGSQYLTEIEEQAKKLHDFVTEERRKNCDDQNNCAECRSEESSSVESSDSEDDVCTVQCRNSSYCSANIGANSDNCMLKSP
jgi:tRNA nucleotidyltransferase/poly(A) polymerase